MTKEEARVYQREYKRKRRTDPEYRAKEREYNIKYRSKPEVKERMREAARKYEARIRAEQPELAKERNLRYWIGHLERLGYKVIAP